MIGSFVKKKTLCKFVLFFNLDLSSDVFTVKVTLSITVQIYQKLVGVMFKFTLLTHMQNTTRRQVEQFKMFIEQNMKLDGWHWIGMTRNTGQGSTAERERSEM